MTRHHLTQVLPWAPKTHCLAKRISWGPSKVPQSLSSSSPKEPSKGKPLIKSLFPGEMHPLRFKVGHFGSGVKAPLLRVSTSATKLKGEVEAGMHQTIWERKNKGVMRTAFCATSSCKNWNS
ncbi:hypothetical protein CDAR_575951 [Caerostris darwini]|uniref:Uncharacterized protein n=1 Tax=Caerostris darwini TaxID=1538125 RepID=A0AAV4X8G3_9ARAC|nr:hypothetical protein CDAR_575951 [Caerostris darwini]